MRRAKIVATFGPAVADYEMARAIIEAGVDIGRLNLSHGSHAVHEAVYATIREAATDLNKPVGILVDLQGPKIRLGKFAEDKVFLANGATFKITIDDILGDVNICSTTYKGLVGDVKPGDELLIDDGRIGLRATAVDATTVTCIVEVGGQVSNNKGINLPGVAVNVPALSEKDEDDLRWALKLGADMIALSFVRNAKDIVRVHEIMAEEGTFLPVIAKIEKPQAVAALEEIIDAFDGVMVARGDLGVELPLEQVPLVQKRAVELARRWAKPVIVATQMLESMITASRPTRAETSDVANAVLDGADALMLSGETSIGEFPLETVKVMAKIIESTEENGLERIPQLGTKPHTHSGAVVRAAMDIAELLGSKYVCVFTESGDTLKRVSRLRSRIPILAFTPNEEVRRQMSLVWGATTFKADPVKHTDDMIKQVDEIVLASGKCRVGDEVVIVAGSPPGIPGSTNSLRVHRVGDAVNQAAPGYAS
ncbi:pyruvate kinase [Candidatus Aquiluna sp. UB-MaderosW2red]|uniref:pyruvate kinase n=1 Tax=Candidatus Aquiluna sp. UB-MaderosW2red TaxID=1855377 RepID=UPI000875E545|nr:pyruvate kinase [Candidatus Aquiluna sp. UB-MaderosW2red]SCX11853.1 pyruvate kinase [Candidatus Aquiluna sp. UB-MaderosW2red]